MGDAAITASELEIVGGDHADVPAGPPEGGRANTTKKAATMPAKRVSRPSVGKVVIGTMPLSPRWLRSMKVAASLPSGQMAP